MPHLVVQYSGNLHDALRRGALVKRLHEAALSTGVFPKGGTRTRAVRCDDYAVADEDPDNGFVDVVVRIGRGRDDTTKTRVGETLLAAVRSVLEDQGVAEEAAVSLELQEIDGEFSWKANPLHRAVAARSGSS